MIALLLALLPAFLAGGAAVLCLIETSSILFAFIAAIATYWVSLILKNGASYTVTRSASSRAELRDALVDGLPYLAALLAGALSDVALRLSVVESSGVAVAVFLVAAWLLTRGLGIGAKEGAGQSSDR